MSCKFCKDKYLPPGDKPYAHCEEWRPIDGYPRYMVSNHGRVKSLTKEYKANFGSYFRKEKVLKPCVEAYISVCIYNDDGKKKALVHRLVAKSFIPNPASKPQVNHKDGNKHNNHYLNLEWVTASENGLHAYRELGIFPHAKGKFGELNHASKSVVQSESGIVINRWGSISDAGREGFEVSCIVRCCKGESKTHKGYEWEYEKTSEST